MDSKWVPLSPSKSPSHKRTISEFQPSADTQRTPVLQKYTQSTVLPILNQTYNEHSLQAASEDECHIRQILKQRESFSPLSENEGMQDLSSMMECIQEISVVKSKTQTEKRRKMRLQLLDIFGAEEQSKKQQLKQTVSVFNTTGASSGFISDNADMQKRRKSHRYDSLQSSGNGPRVKTALQSLFFWKMQDLQVKKLVFRMMDKAKAQSYSLVFSTRQELIGVYYKDYFSSYLHRIMGNSEALLLISPTKILKYALFDPLKNILVPGTSQNFDAVYIEN